MVMYASASSSCGSWGTYQVVSGRLSLHVLFFVCLAEYAKEDVYEHIWLASKEADVVSHC